ncbi:MAG: cytochrome b [Panacagrimonas sp.]
MANLPVVRYGNTAIALHWLIALLIFGGWGLGFYMVDLKLSPTKLKYFSWHKWIGITILMLACLRAAWRVTHPAPPANPAHPLWQRRAASAAHLALYVLMFAIPLSGWTYSSASGYPVKYFGVIPLPDLVAKSKELAGILKEVHELLGWALVLVLAAHVAGALQHHFLHRDDTLARMLPWVRRRSS